jgi:hypothetical protein
MNTKAFSAMLALALSFGMIATAGAQSTTTQTTTTTTNYSQTNSNLAGQVSTQNAMLPDVATNPFFWGQVRERQLTLVPGTGRFGMNHVGIGDAVKLDLINPSDTPMLFETSQRLGKEISVVVPARSVETVQFRYNKPISDEVSFLVTPEPASTLSAMAQPAPETAAVPGVINTPMVQINTPAVQMPQGMQQPVNESRSTVRGYW